jgi:hypothetical protein
MGEELFHTCAYLTYLPSSIPYQSPAKLFASQARHA